MVTSVVKYPHHFDLNGNRIGNLGTPGSATEATTKAYVDALALGDGSYTPAVAGNWSPVPATVVAALDQLAARVYALEHP